MKINTKIIGLLMLTLLIISGCKKDNDEDLKPTTATAPQVKSTDPTNDETEVRRNKTIIINFKTSMSAASIDGNTFQVMKGKTLVSGTVAYSNNTATFTPSIHFEANTLYTVTLNKEVRDIAGVAMGANTVWSFTTSSTAEVLAPVQLGSSANYVILAKTAINNSPTSTITGDLGISPAATTFITGLSLVDFTGYATSSQVTGRVYAADMAPPTNTILTIAVNDMITGYNDAAGRPNPEYIELGTGNIGGMTLTSGLYKWTGTVTIPTNLTITGGADDVWIFQIAGDLTQSSSVAITLNGGAQAKNIFWQFAGHASFGTNSHIEGNILCMTGITYLTGASMNGRALAQTAVILDANTITKLQ